MVATTGHNDCSHKVIAALMALYDEEFDLELRDQQKQQSAKQQHRTECQSQVGAAKI
jgi:hypothetical protein